MVKMFLVFIGKNGLKGATVQVQIKHISRGESQAGKGGDKQFVDDLATHQASTPAAPIGTTRGEVVYELFFTTLPVDAFTPADVVALYLHRGAFEIVLSDEDQEQAASRWCSHTAWGQEFWLILAQW